MRKRFTNPRYCTSTIISTVPKVYMNIMWEKIDELPEDRDYLQVFEFFKEDGRQKFRHRAEEPQHCTEYDCALPVPDMKIYVIDDGDHSTMLFADEY